MEIEVIAKGRNMRYDAVGMYDGKGLTVLKGFFRNCPSDFMYEVT